jgi:hypothetical protein
MKFKSSRRRTTFRIPAQSVDNKISHKTINRKPPKEVWDNSTLINALPFSHSASCKRNTTIGGWVERQSQLGVAPENVQALLKSTQKWKRKIGSNLNRIHAIRRPQDSNCHQVEICCAHQKERNNWCGWRSSLYDSWPCGPWLGLIIVGL